jgi:hypothetical protein
MTSQNGNPDREYLLAGMEAIVAIVNHVDVEILLRVNIYRYQAFHMMVAMQIM